MSQLNRRKLRVGSCTEEVCKWFNCPVQGPISDAKLASRRYQIDLHHCFARALSRPIWQWRKLYCTCSLMSKFPQQSVVAAVHKLLGKNTGNEAMDKFVQTFDARCRGTQAHQNNRSYESSADLPSKFSMVDGYTENLEKPQNHQNWGVGTCTGIVACPGQYSIYIVFLLLRILMCSWCKWVSMNVHVCKWHTNQ